MQGVQGKTEAQLEEELEHRSAKPKSRGRVCLQKLENISFFFFSEKTLWFQLLNYGVIIWITNFFLRKIFQINIIENFYLRRGALLGNKV